MDELLYERVQQLRAIDERLERMQRMLYTKPDILPKTIQDLRNELACMIRQAEADHAAF